MELLNKIQQELKVGKTRWNKHSSFWYRSCEDILQAIKPLLGEDATVTMDDEIVLIGDRYYVKATVTLAERVKGDDDKFRGTKSIGYAREVLDRKGMSPDQITGAASSYARKYALNGLFCIDDSQDTDMKPDENGDLPPKPTEAEDKILTDICRKIEKKTNKKVSKSKLAGLFMTEGGKYPANPDMTDTATQWIIDLNRESEWVEAEKVSVMDKINQAFFDFETQNQPYLQDQDGKVEYDKDKFIKVITKALGGLPETQSIEEILAVVKPENVTKKITGE